MSDGEHIESPPVITDLATQGSSLVMWFNNVWKFLKRRESNVTDTYNFSTAAGKVASMEVRNGIIISITVT